ncbi:MAG: hypothetical protein GY750_03775 [Lentisphaerae bacterium]|nr:hypothetical protein [Lentisphaerota bacterium]
MDDSVNGAWYWVTDGKDTWPAMRDDKAAGGWSNGDTWEDFTNDITGFEKIREDDLPLDRLKSEVDDLRAAIAELERYFTSGNNVPVERATIKADDFRRIVDV